jgi:hypothetical protein
MTMAMRKRPRPVPGANRVPNPVLNPNPAANGTPPAAAPNPASTITLICRAVNLSSVDSFGEQPKLPMRFSKRFRRIRFLIPKRRSSRGDITPDEASGTFTFGITVTLQNPLNL